MSDGTKIEWSEATWSPVTGCTRISDGCLRCYIDRTPPFRMQHRRFDLPVIGGTTGVKLHSERLGIPMRWRKPRRIFVCSLADLFHEQVPDQFIAEVFAVMSLAPQHTFQVLTKRHARMRSLLNSGGFWVLVNAARMARGVSVLPDDRPVLLPNVWLGVSVESQKWADLRIPALLDTPAAVRWLSCEPLLGAVDLSAWTEIHAPWTYTEVGVRCSCGEWMRDEVCPQQLGWIVIGGESGPGARPMHPDWARDLRDQCQEASVPFFFKQHGVWVEADRDNATHLLQVNGALVDRKNATVDNPYGYGSGLVQDLVDRGHPGWVRVRRVSKSAAGRELDGRTWDEYPQLAEAVA